MAKGKKQEDPNKVAQRKAERVAFVQSHPNLAPEVARQRFYVQTRANELEAAGKDVDRAALRAKFQTGGVTREGFYTPGDISRFSASRNTDSLSDSKNTPTVTPTTPVSPVAPSATPTPSTSKPSGVKTPSTSYQAPQTTTSLGQVVSTPAPSGTLAASKNTAGPNVRAGVGTRRVDTSMPAVGVPEIAGVTWRAPGVLPDAVITSPQRVPTAVKSKTQIQLSGKGGQNLAAWRANQNKWDREEFAADRLVNTGIVMAAETAGGILGSLGGPTGSVAGASLAAGLAYNLTNRLSNWRSDGRYQGDTTLAGAAKVSAVSGIAGGATLGVIKAVPKVAPVWTRVQNWANDVRVAAPAPKALEQTTGRAFGGTPGQVIETNLGQIAPRSMAIPGEQPFKPFAETVETKAGNKVKDKVVNLVRRNKVQEATPVVAPKSSPTILPAEPVAPKFTPEVTRESGLVIPASTKRTRSTAQIVRDIENATPEQASAVGKKAIDDVLGKADNQPVSLHDAKQAKLQRQADEILAGGEKTYDQMTPNEKRAYTRKQNKLKNQNIEVKTETVGAAKPEPVVAPKPKASTKKKPTKEFNQFEDAWDETATRKNTELVFDDVFDDGDQTLREFGIDPTPPVKTTEIPEVEVKPTVNAQPVKRPNETDAQFGKRLRKWEMANSGSVQKMPAGFEQPRLTGREKTMEVVEAGMSRNKKLAFIDDMSDEMRPKFGVVQGESAERLAMMRNHPAFTSKLPEAPANLSEVKAPRTRDRFADINEAGFEQPRGNYMERSMERFESRMSRTSRIDDAGATPEGGIPPKPKGLGLKNAAYDPETGAWRSRRLDPDTGEFVWVKKRNIAKTPEEKAALTAASELKKQTNRKASRAAAAQLKQEAVAAANAPAANVEYEPFLHKGNLFKTKVELERGAVPDWAQQNINLTTEAKPLSVGEQTWLENATRPLTETETAYRRELLSSIAKNRGKRVTKATREATSTEITEYIRKFKALRGEDGGVTIGAMPVALDDTQVALEREIEQVLGTNALNAIKSIAIKGEVAPLTQNIDLGLGSLAEVKTGTPLINKLEARKALPSASGRLREQAAEFFNAEGKLKGMTGAGRVRTWQRLTQSDWFRELDRLEPSFANYLRTQNAQLETWSRQGIEEGAASLPKPGIRRPANLKSGMTTTEIEQAIRTKLNKELVDDGLGAYSVDPEDLAESTPFARDRGLTVEQRSEAAQIERGLEFRTRVLRRIKAEDQAAFGDINNWNRGFEANQALAFDDPNTMDIAADYGIVGRNNIANISDVEFRSGVRELNQPYRPADPNSSITDPANELKAAMTEKRKAIYAAYNEGKITKAERQAQFDALNAENQAELNRIYDLPQSGPSSNPFAQEFGTALPNDYVRTMPESFGKVWDPDTWTNEFGTKVNGRWVEQSWAAEKAASRTAAQRAMPEKIETGWLNRHQPIDGKSWIQDAAERAQRSRTVKPEPFPMWDAQGRMIKNPADVQAEIARRESLDRAAAKARAAAPQGKTAEQIRFELKNPTSPKAEAVAGAVDPAPQKLEGTWSDVYRADRLDYFKEEIQASDEYYKNWSSGDD